MQHLFDLPKSAHLYFGVVIAAGISAAVSAGVQVYSAAPPNGWLVLAALTSFTGSFTIRVPTISARISVSDAFVFASVLLFGPATATVIVALDCLVMILWSKRSLLQSLFNLSATALAISIAAHAFYWLAGVTPGGQDLVLTTLLLPLFALAALYFLINTGLLAVALAFERRLQPWGLWCQHFPWLSLNYFGGVSVAALLVSYTRSVDLAAVSIILPLLMISYLTYRASFGRVQDAQQHVEQLNELYMSTIEALAMAVDAKDQITHGHIRRVQVYALELARHLGVNDPRQLKAIETAALLHDMGKLAIPEHILNKPAKLTSAEFEKIKRHADIGADLLSSVKFPYPVIPIVRHHHENWDGTGYPSGIAGVDIPLGARILAVVDCFDALISDRPYRPRLSPTEAFRIISRRRSTMYDPLVVDTFIRVYEVIAPKALQAGQEARSMIDAAFMPQVPSAASTPLREICSNASEAVLLDRCSGELARSTSTVSTLHIAAQYLRQLTPATVYALFEYDGDTDALACVCTSGDTHRLIDGLVIGVGERVSGWAAANRRTCMNSDASLDLAHIAVFINSSLRSAISTPILDGTTLIGVLTAYSPRPEAFSEEHRYVFEHVAREMGGKVATATLSRAPQILPFHKVCV